MKEKNELLMKLGIPAADWEKTPSSVRMAIQVVYEQVEELKATGYYLGYFTRATGINGCPVKAS